MDNYGSPIGAAMDRLGFGAASDYGMQAPNSGGATMGYGLRGSTSGGATMGYGLDPGALKNLWDTQLATWGQTLDTQAQQQQAAQQQSAANWGGAQVSTAGGDWAALDQHNSEIANSAAKYGIPANLLKSMINNESSGDWARDNRVFDDNGTPLLPFVGMKPGAAQSVGFDFNAMIGNKQMQIDAMAAILARDYKTYGSWDMAASNYLSGDPNAYQNPSAMDVEGRTNVQQYVTKALNNWHYLDSLGGASQDPASAAYGTGYTGAGDAASSAVLQHVASYVGVPYVWSGTSDTGWDCSGFTWAMDQKYGGGKLPQGSHQQYSYAQQTGQLFTNAQQLQPGDLIFLDTHWADPQNSINMANHVAIYLGGNKIIQAANESVGTIISPLDATMQQATFLGAMHQSYSSTGGGSAYGTGPSYGTGAPQQQASYNPQQVMMRLLSGQTTPGY